MYTYPNDVGELVDSNVSMMMTLTMTTTNATVLIVAGKVGGAGCLSLLRAGGESYSPVLPVGGVRTTSRPPPVVMTMALRAMVCDVVRKSGNRKTMRMCMSE
jgi:hypothetical protein